MVNQDFKTTNKLELLPVPANARSYLESGMSVAESSMQWNRKVTGLQEGVYDQRPPGEQHRGTADDG